jgi:hypothetical protein
MSMGNYNRIVSWYSRELLEGTVGEIARSAEEDGVKKGIRNERERILEIIINASIGTEGYCHAETIIQLIKVSD